MSRAKWDQLGEKEYETGVDRGMLYPQADDGKYQKGVVWNGISKVSDSPSGAEPSAVWADNKKYLNLIGAEEYAGNIEAYMSPEEFDECDGSLEIAPGVYAGQQNRRPFGFAYRSIIGNDTKQNDYGYKIHIVYGATAKPTSVDHSTVNDSPDPAALSWEFSTTPVDVPGGKPTAKLTINSTKTDPAKLKALEDILYGTDGVDGSGGTEPRLPLPEEVIAIMGELDNGAEG